MVMHRRHIGFTNYNIQTDNFQVNRRLRINKMYNAGRTMTIHIVEFDENILYRFEEAHQEEPEELHVTF